MSNSKRVNNSELVYEIEDLIKKYNKKPEKKVKKKDIVKLLQNADIIIAARIDFQESDVFGEVIEGTALNPDIVKDARRVRMLPIFTSYSQIPSDYMDTFSFIKVPASFACEYMNECENINGIVINPFTEYNMELAKKKNIKAGAGETKSYGRSNDEMPEAMIIYKNKKYKINSTPFTIGRENSNIVIPETYISKIHAIISYKDGKFRIADYESTNGTKLNNTQLRPKVYYELRDGFTIELSEKEKMLVYLN